MYLRLLIFLPEILIPACASSSLAFHMIYTAYKLNKQGDNIQPCHTPFPIWNQSVVPHLILTVASYLHTDFSGGRSGGLVFPSLKNFPVCCDLHKAFGKVNKAVDVFLEYLAFLMIQQMLAILSLVPLPFLNPA